MNDRENDFIIILFLDSLNESKKNEREMILNE
jgi:hypothetical protein